MISSYALDGALDRVRQASRLDLCSGHPQSIADLDAMSMGSCTSLRVSGPEPLLMGDGRRVVVQPGDGKGTKQGRPTMWVLSGNGQILACDEITNAPMLTPGVTFRPPVFEVAIDQASGT